MYPFPNFCLGKCSFLVFWRFMGGCSGFGGKSIWGKEWYGIVESCYCSISRTWTNRLVCMVVGHETQRQWLKEIKKFVDAGVT